MILGKMQLPYGKPPTYLKIGLVGCWEFDYDGSDANGDSSLEWSMFPYYYDSGVMNYCAYFNSIYNYATLDSQYLPSFGYDLTINVWVKFDSFTNDAAQVILYQAYYGQWTLATYWDGAQRMLSFSLNSQSEGKSYYLERPYNFSTGVWYMITARQVWGCIELYVNGTYLYSFFPYGGVIENLTPTGTLVLAKSYWDMEPMLGSIDQLSIWNSPLSEQQIGMLYNSGNGLPYSEW